MNHTRRLQLTRKYGDDEQFDCMVEVDIDLDRIAESFGRRALMNKSKKAKALHGMLSVSVRVIRPGEQ